MSPGRDSAAGAVTIVGAGPGVGAAVARRFGREGHPVGLLARDAQRLATLAGQLRDDGLQVELATGDARRPGDVRNALSGLQSRQGATEILCFSPLPDVATIKPVAETSAEDLQAALELGVVGAAAAVGQVLPAMRRARRGTLLFTTGSAALTPIPQRATSGIANAAQSVYIRMLHDALGDDGIFALHTVIVGPIGPDGHDPEDIAEAMFQAHVARAEAQIVIR